MKPLPELRLKPGQIVGGHYQIVRLLGRGAFGETYLAENRHFAIAPNCAVKLLRPRSTDAYVLQKAKQLFERETVVLARLGRHDCIPLLLAHFEENGEFYLVQDFVEGVPLNRELLPGMRFNEEYVVQLLGDILQVLKFVHQQRVIHRDIKPSNLIRRHRDRKLVLIDFGAVSALGALGTGETPEADSTSIGTRGYVPAEQFNGNPRYSSDVYAVGILGIQALTGLNPREGLPIHERTGELVWRDRAEVSSWLAAILDKMVRSDYRQRYRSATEALQALNHHPAQLDPTTLMPAWLPAKLEHWHERVKNKAFLLKTAIGVGATAFLGLALWGAIQVKQHSFPSVPEKGLSYGEEVLLGRTIGEAKLAGVEALSKGRYRKAVERLQRARQELSTDPETLIYLNNAWLAEQQLKADTIAVAVPISSDPDAAQEILRGVAQAQNEFHWGDSHWDDGDFDRKQPQRRRGLRVLIVDDAEGGEIEGGKTDPARSHRQQIATTLAERPEILAVIGHASSGATLSVAEIYQQYQLVLISATSTSIELSKIGKTNPYLFRTVPSDRTAAQKLADYLQGQKPVVFYNPNSPYSESFHNAFRNAIFPVDSVDLSPKSFDAYAALDAATEAGATALVLLPDRSTLDAAIDVLQANQNHPQLPQPFQFIAGGDSIYANDPTLTEGGAAAVGLVVPVPWHALSSPNSDFATQAQRYWGSASWRTAMAYDATRALLAALEGLKERDRNHLQQALAAKGFSASGATNQIGFDRSGDRSQALSTLVQIVACEGNPGVRFVPIDLAEKARNRPCVSGLE